MEGSASTGAAPSRGRGRGRGGARGGARGAGAFGVQRHTNLSWRKPDDADSPAPDTDDAAEEPSQQATSAFATGGSAFSAFGATSSGFGGSAFPPSGELSGQPAASTSAFGTPPSNPFGNKAFGDAAAAVSNAFGQAPKNPSHTFGGSAFSGSAFGAPLSTGTALFRAPSQQSDGGSGDAAVVSVPERRAPGQASSLEVLGEDSDARKKRFEATLPNNRYLEVRTSLESHALIAARLNVHVWPSLNRFARSNGSPRFEQAQFPTLPNLCVSTKRPTLKVLARRCAQSGSAKSESIRTMSIRSNEYVVALQVPTV